MTDIPQTGEWSPVEPGLPDDWRASFLVGARREPVSMQWIYWPEFDVNWMNPAPGANPAQKEDDRGDPE